MQVTRYYTGLIAGLHDNGTSAITPEDAVATICPVCDARHDFRTYHQCAFGHASFNEAICSRHRVDKATANRLYIEDGTTCNNQLILQDTRGAGEGMVGCSRRHNDQVDILGLQSGGLDSTL